MFKNFLKTFPILCASTLMIPVPVFAEELDSALIPDSQTENSETKSKEPTNQTTNEEITDNKKNTSTEKAKVNLDSANKEEEKEKSSDEISKQWITKDDKEKKNEKNISDKLKTLTSEPDIQVKITEDKPGSISLAAILNDYIPIKETSNPSEDTQTDKINTESISLLDSLMIETTKVKETVVKLDEEKPSMSLIGSISLKSNIDKKEDEIGYVYRSGSQMALVKGYNETNLESKQDVHVDFYQLSPIHLRILTLAKDNQSMMNEAAKTILESADTQLISSDSLSLINKNAEPPKIEKKSEEVKITQGEEFDAEEFVEKATDAAGNELNYQIEGDVDSNTPGTYEVRINAVDLNGNESSETMFVEVSDRAISIGQTIANAALAQVGVTQDCTMLVTNALASVGINYHDWPMGYLNVGTAISYDQALPGDVLIYPGHVAIYIGDGMAVHGGWNGWTTVVAPVVPNPAQGLLYVVRPMV